MFSKLGFHVILEHSKVVDLAKSTSTSFLISPKQTRGTLSTMCIFSAHKATQPLCSVNVI